MNKCPLLLKYKIRDCYSSSEAEIDSNLHLDQGSWTYHGTKKCELWKLRLPDGQGYVTDSEGDVIHLNKYEIFAVGDVNPIIMDFIGKRNIEKSDTVRIFQLPENYIRYDSDTTWTKYLKNYTESVLNEYERCRDDWQTRITVGLPF